MTTNMSEVYMSEGDWEDAPETGTGTYVVLGVFDDDDTFNLSPAYGPFDSMDEASKYGTRNFQFSWVCEISTVEGSVQASPDIHPDQTSISDYIDPSVVE